MLRIKLDTRDKIFVQIYPCKFLSKKYNYVQIIKKWENQQWMKAYKNNANTFEFTNDTSFRLY